MGTTRKGGAGAEARCGVALISRKEQFAVGRNKEVAYPSYPSCMRWAEVDLRSGDDDLCVDELLVELGVLALLVRRGDERVALLLDPLADAQLVLSGTEELRLLLSVDAALLPLALAET